MRSRIHTVGAHAIAVATPGPARVDAARSGASAQVGRLGHAEITPPGPTRVEAGYQLPRAAGAPWLRVGIDRSSGDDDPLDDEHETFFQLLPTARIYAQFPFYNLMNIQDVFAQLMLKPHPRVTVRTDYHWLRVTEGRDLWYSGGGATNDDVFGFSGIPANGRRELAHLVDVSVTVRGHRAG